MSLVIVDDQSSQIKYTGLWTGGGTSGHYDNTASSSRVAGATMTFPFSGTSVSVAGSFDANTSCTGSFSLDANVTTFVSPVLENPLNHQTIWTSAPLTDGNHTLTYTLSSCSSSNTAGYVWFDYILYSPSSNASTNGLVYFVDDTDSHIDYSGDWTVENNNDEDFELSSHGGKQGCSFQIEFEGTSVSVHGRIGNDSAGIATQASFSLDGSSPVVFSTAYQNTISYNQPLFQSDSLEKGKHTLVATAQSGTVWVDYLLLQPGPSTDSTTLTSPHHSSVNVGEIAGIALGAFFLAVGIALSVIFRRRLFKGRHLRATPSRPLSRPSDINVSDARETSSSNHVPWQSETITTTYPPTLSSHSFRMRSPDPNPFDTPPISPRSGTFVTSSSGHSRIALSTADYHAIVANAPPPLTGPTSCASSSGHSLRPPSLGGAGDSDSVAELKRRQQLAPAYDDSLSIATSGSRASSLRPLPVIPPEGSRRPGASGSSTIDDLDLPPPVYTLRI
ncbi:hypothetical protein C8R44DRAFT_723730 [Mycena epipterygia]|nr:hypothetical protein C8R44DRAFT_723730 [Mycena epipterygia]